MLTRLQLDRYADVLLWGLHTSRPNPYAPGDVVLVQYDLAALRLAEAVYAKLLEQGLNPIPRLTLTQAMLQRYKGPEGLTPPLDRLGGTRWKSVRERAKKAIERIAADLVEMYAYRQVAKGYAYGPTNELYLEFEATFGFEETPDQERAIAEVLADMGFCLCFSLSAQAAELVDRVVAVVNGKLITLFDVNARVTDLLQRTQGVAFKPDDPRNAELQKQVLESLINDILIEQEAVRLKVTVSETELDSQIDELKKKNNLTQQELQTELLKEGMEVSQFTYFQQVGGIDLSPVSVELTYGLERITMEDYQEYFLDFVSLL